MKQKTYLRSAARKIGMKPGNLSVLAKKWGVSIADEAALMALGREHQREPAQDDEILVSMTIVEKEIHKLCQKHRQQCEKHHKEGAKIILDLEAEGNILRKAVLDVADALQPVLSHGCASLTEAQVSAIQAIFSAPGNHEAGLAVLRERQHDMEAL